MCKTLLFPNMCRILAAGMQAERGKTIRSCANTSLNHLLGGDVRWQLFIYVSSLCKLTEAQKAGTTTNKTHFYKKSPLGKDNQLKVEGKANLFIFEKDVIDVLVFVLQELRQLVVS